MHVGYRTGDCMITNTAIQQTNASKISVIAVVNSVSTLVNIIDYAKTFRQSGC